MDESIKDMLDRGCRRTLRAILTVKEDVADPYLSEEDSDNLRKAILDHVNQFHKFCVDVMESANTNTMGVNALYLEKLEQIHQDVLALYEDY